jgi:hypothetical protein
MKFPEKRRFSVNQATQGNPWRRGSATSHKEFPQGNAELAEKRRFYPKYDSP